MRVASTGISTWESMNISKNYGGCVGGARCGGYTVHRLAKPSHEIAAPTLTPDLASCVLMKFRRVLNPSLKLLNLLASRMARLARFILKAGRWFSIENPEASLMWKFSPLVSLASLPGSRCPRATNVLWGVSTPNQLGGFQTPRG